MHNDDDVENALENKNYLFSLFCVKNLFVLRVLSLKLKILFRKAEANLNSPTQSLHSKYEQGKNRSTVS